MKILLCFSCLLFAGLNAAATAVLVDVGGSQYLDFQDGRKALLTHALAKVVRVPIHLRQIENTCDPGQVLARCDLNLDFAMQHQYLRWTTHPDAAKIGKVVQAKYKGDSNLITLEDEFQSYFWFNTLTNPQWAGRFQPDMLSCDNYLWTAQMPKSGENLLIQSWTSEIMLPNPETGVNENQTFSGSFNVELAVTPAGLRIAKLGPSHQVEGSPPYVSAQVSNLTFEGPAHQQCQISFEADIQDLRKIFLDPTVRVADPTTEVPLNVPAELGKGGAIRTRLMEFLSPTSILEAQ
jgi:hypothetical protein